MERGWEGVQEGKKGEGMVLKVELVRKGSFRKWGLYLQVMSW